METISIFKQNYHTFNLWQFGAFLPHYFNLTYRSAGTSTNPSAICQISSTSMLAALAQYSISDLVLVSTIQDRKCCPNIRKYQIEFIKWEIWAWEMFTSSLTWNNIICYCIVCLYPVRCGMCWVCSSPGQPSPPGYCWAAFVVECYNVVHTRKVLVYKIKQKGKKD